MIRKTILSSLFLLPIFYAYDSGDTVGLGVFLGGMGLSITNHYPVFQQDMKRRVLMTSIEILYIHAIACWAIFAAYQHLSLLLFFSISRVFHVLYKVLGGRPFECYNNDEKWVYFVFRTIEIYLLTFSRYHYLV